MSRDLGSNVKIPPQERFKALAKAHGWSLEHARGYVDGETFRLRRKPPSKYVLVGIDEYSLGFRAGYYERQGPESTTRDLPVASR